ncbi:unnamed protein product [Angiostrongylus costaricensis]|uniref:Carn_acyltransf domain-containing protein n=1 Tax=Angiostrongylus costaricensis TaxID=334426 RepID=A0A0R3PK24_ANGCS|nr:unnamed protein product [Angiostrongylus costaricensis]
MSLLPVRSFVGDVFLEARMLGQPVAAIYQIGFSIDAPECSVALFCNSRKWNRIESRDRRLIG